MTDEIKRDYVVPLRRGFANTPRYRRTNKAVRVLKEFLVKHMKSDNIKIGPQLNLLLWKNGIKNPPGKVKVTATKDKEGMVRVELTGVEYKDFKVKEKTEKNQSFKEKLQGKVKDAKEGTKSKSEEKTEKKEVKKEAKDVKQEVKAEEKKAEEKPAASVEDVLEKPEEKPAPADAQKKEE